jgi:hypothetical protein
MMGCTLFSNNASIVAESGTPMNGLLWHQHQQWQQRQQQKAHNRIVILANLRDNLALAASAAQTRESTCCCAAYMQLVSFRLHKHLHEDSGKL